MITTKKQELCWGSDRREDVRMPKVQAAEDSETSAD